MDVLLTVTDGEFVAVRVRRAEVVGFGEFDVDTDADCTRDVVCETVEDTVTDTVEVKTDAQSRISRILLLLLSATIIKVVFATLDVPYATDSPVGEDKRPFNALKVEFKKPDTPLEPAMRAATAEFDTSDTFKAYTALPTLSATKRRPRRSSQANPASE